MMPLIPIHLYTVLCRNLKLSDVVILVLGFIINKFCLTLTGILKPHPQVGALYKNFGMLILR